MIGDIGPLPLNSRVREMITVRTDEWNMNKAIADGMRAAARYMKTGRVKDFQTAMAEVMDLIKSEE